MRKLLGIGSLALVAVAVPLGAFAADMAVKAPPPPPAPVATWTGCYVGGNAGWIGSNDSYHTAPGGSYLNPASTPSPPNLANSGLLGVDPPTLTHDYSSNANGGLIGAQVGCNKQYNYFVIGGEADGQWTSSRGSSFASYAAFPDLGNPAFTNPAHTESVTSDLNWLATFRARAGFAFNNFFVYGTGGLATGGVSSSTNISFGTIPVNPVFNGAVHLGSEQEWRTGWTAGGGVEYLINANWSVKGEYLYVDLGSRTYNSPLVAAIAPSAVGSGYFWQTTVRDRENIVRFGVNYHFNGPILARY